MDLVDEIDADFPEQYEQLWTDIEYLASRLFTSDDRNSSWHHFLFACGNFKRQGGTVIRPRWGIAPAEWGPDENPGAIALPAGELMETENRPSWGPLARIRGMGLATTTTSLAALWPRNHAIMDRLARNAALGWALIEERDDEVVPSRDSHGRPKIADWDLYEWYRRFLKEKAKGDRLQSVERPLFKLDQALRRQLKSKYSKLTWGEYADKLKFQDTAR